MKGLSVVVTVLLFVVAIALSRYLKKTGAIPADMHRDSVSQYTLNYGIRHNSGATASFASDFRQYRN